MLQRRINMFELFYRSYAAECAALGVPPLAPPELLALIAALLERSTALIH